MSLATRWQQGFARTLQLVVDKAKRKDEDVEEDPEGEEGASPSFIDEPVVELFFDALSVRGATVFIGSCRVERVGGSLAHEPLQPCDLCLVPAEVEGFGEDGLRDGDGPVRSGGRRGATARECTAIAMWRGDVLEVEAGGCAGQGRACDAVSQAGCKDREAVHGGRGWMDGKAGWMWQSERASELASSY